MASPKTYPVLFKDRTKGRAVRLTERNNRTVLNWIPGAVYKSSVAAKTGQESNQRIMLPINGSKTIRAAYYGDWIVKTDKGFQIVKFDKWQETLFFVDVSAPAPLTNRAFNRWVKDLEMGL